MTLSSRDDNIVSNVFPVVMQNSAITLYDDEGNSVSDFGELSNNEPAIIPSAINVEGSSDVIVGPVTQFHGSVTIYQNGNPPQFLSNTQNGKLTKSEQTSSDEKDSESKTCNSQFFKHLKFIMGIAITSTLILALVITTPILLLKTEPSVSSSPPKEFPDRNERNVTFGPIGSGLIIDKDTWGGSPASNKIKLKLPISYVIIAHTVSSFYDTFEDCSAKVRNIQQDHFTRNLDDICYNFLIGGDGNAYVGRGWDVKNCIANETIAIAFIGNFVRHNLSLKMIEITQRLLNEGLEKRKLSEDYKLIAHKQMTATESPGTHVIDVISKWPHYQAGFFKLD